MSVKGLAVFVALLVICMAQPVAFAETSDSPVILSGGPSFTIEDMPGYTVDYSVLEQYAYSDVHVSLITAQLMLNGQPYEYANLPITFTSDNDSVAVLDPNNRTRPSDKKGQAKILLIANNTEGIVNITASAQTMWNHVISDTCTVRVVGWGTISGIVTDSVQKGLPAAKVTVWLRNGSQNVRMLNMSDNPQFTNDGSTAAIGMYTFTYVPSGYYNVTAEFEGHQYYAWTQVRYGTSTANVAIPDYVYTPTPAPTPSPSPTPTPTVTPTPTPKVTPGFDVLIAAGVLGLSGLLLRKRQ